MRTAKVQAMWDLFTKIPGKTYKGSNGDVAVDHYHRYKEDVALMAELGLKAYRFSVSWPRIYPEGKGEINESGLHFYDCLINELLSHNIEPVLTLYHLDVPQALMDEYGAWESRQITITSTRKHAPALFADRSNRHWIVLDPEGNFWALPPVENPWDHRQPFQPKGAADLERVPGHYKCMLGLPF
jgi:6-phospho-beta-glucosidase